MTTHNPTAADPLELAEVKRRLPALALIADDDLRNQVAAVSATAPDYFWTTNASSSDYHHPACRGDRGLWAHTLMLSTTIHRLADSYVEQGRLTRTQIDHAHAAAILHDQRKEGVPRNPNQTATTDHDETMAEHVYATDLPDQVADAIASHMGPWYAGPKPATDLDDLVHTADMVASTATITPGLPAPVPEELADLPVPEVELS